MSDHLKMFIIVSDVDFMLTAVWLGYKIAWGTGIMYSTAHMQLDACKVSTEQLLLMGVVPSTKCVAS